MTLGYTSTVMAPGCSSPDARMSSASIPHSRLRSVFPNRRPPTEERIHTFFPILGEEITGNRVAGQAVGVTQRHLELPIEHSFARCDGGRRFGCDKSREGLYFGIESLGRHHAIDESHLARSQRVDRLACEEQLHGVLATDCPAEGNAGRGTEGPDVHSRCGE